MPIRVSCPTCGKEFNAKDEMAGTKAKCPCGAVITVPQKRQPAKPKGAQQRPSSPSKAASPKPAVGQESMIVVRCASCGKSHRAKASMAGKAVRCTCGAAMRVPQRQKKAPSPIAAAPKSGLDSLFDEVSDDELHAASLPKPPEPTKLDKHAADHAVLQRYVGNSKEMADHNRPRRPGGLIAIGILNLVFGGFCLIGVLLVVVIVVFFATAEFGAGFKQGLESRGVPAVLLLGVVGLSVGLWLATGFSLCRGRTQTSWYVAVFSYSFGIASAIVDPFLVPLLASMGLLDVGHTSLDARDVIYSLTRTAFAVGFLSYLLTNSVIDFYSVKMNRFVGVGICFGIGSVVAVAIPIVAAFLSQM